MKIEECPVTITKTVAYPTDQKLTINWSDITNDQPVFCPSIWEPLHRMCGNCNYRDNVVLTSNPPQYRCTIDGSAHFGNFICDKELTFIRKGYWVEEKGKIRAVYKCSICGKEALLDDSGYGSSLTPDLYQVKSAYCPNCGAQMEERNGNQQENTSKEGTVYG